MNRSNKSKIAVTLLGALAFGANAQAQDFSKNKIIKTDSFSIIKGSKLGGKSAQTIGAVGGANSNKNLENIKKGLSILEKVFIGLGITAGVAEAANETVAGVRWGMGKETDSIFTGKCSITNLIRIRSKSKKDEGGGEHVDKKKIQSVKKNKRKNIRFENKKGKYYESNIRMIIQNGKLSSENAERLVNFINSKDNSFLDEIYSVHIPVEMLRYKHYSPGGKLTDSLGNAYNKLTEAVTKEAGVAKGESWVEKMFGGIRGEFNITRLPDVAYIHSSIPGGGGSTGLCNNDKDTIIFRVDDGIFYTIKFLKDDKGNDLLLVSGKSCVVVYLLDK